MAAMSHVSRGAMRRQPQQAPDSVSVVLAAVVSAALVTLIGIAIALILTLGSWALAPHSDNVGPDETARLAVGMWLYAQHVPLELNSAFSLGVVPLGLVLIPGLLCYVCGRQLPPPG